MAPPKQVPDIKTLLRWRDEEGLTHQEMADRVYSEFGYTVTRGAISAEFSRQGYTTPAVRHTDTLPWRVEPRHLDHYDARMLRNLGRRRKGEPLTPGAESRLNSWLKWIEEHHCVVGYAPETPEGFWYVPPVGRDGKDGIPIRRGYLKPEDIIKG